MFFARHDGNGDVKRLFDEVWSANTGGPRAATLYVEDIAKLTTQHLASPRWIVKHAAALSVADMIEALSVTQGRITDVNARLLWPALKQALAEKTWDGKEKVLEGLVTLVGKAGTGSTGGASFADAGEIGKVSRRQTPRKPTLSASRKVKRSAPQKGSKVSSERQTGRLPTVTHDNSGRCPAWACHGQPANSWPGYI